METFIARQLPKLNIHRIRQLNSTSKLQEAEFKVFSQGGEDGIIQFLLANLVISNRSFIEFGVETYIEANTRFLLLNDDWRGLVIDGNSENIRLVCNDPKTYARHDLIAKCDFITRENVNRLFTDAGFIGEIGLLSVDVDGNDYWLWEAIDCVSPAIVVCEYNSVFGSDAEVSVPYDPQFNRSKAHYSCLYFGASLPALCYLAEKKGYDFVGSNSMGNNAFFVRKDLRNNIPRLTAKEGYVLSTHRLDSRDEKGRLTRMGGRSRWELIQDLPLVNVQTKERCTLRERGF
jgi:hypothetical protein